MSKRRSRIVVVALALVGAVGCGGTDYESLHRGECLPSTAKVVGEREPAPPTVDCSEPHRYQVYGVTQLDGPRTYPGEEVVDQEAEHQCFLLFEPNLGYPAAQMPDDVKVVYLQPTESSWNDQADREVECLLIYDDDTTGDAVTESNEQATETTTGGDA